MPWPSRSDYTQAIRDYPHISILDPKLKGGNPRRGSNNYLMFYSGGFSTVFPIEVLSNTYALRCWVADIGDAETRYRKISDYLNQCRLPYFVDFAYVPEGILVNGIRYPITRMEWAEGETLCDFIKQNLQDAGCLKTAAAEFQEMVATLHTHQISHGDLQDGNILLKRNGTDVEIRLIDYDSLFVPALRGQPDNIVGVPAYQHPQRIAGGGEASEKVDYFSELVIYLSLLSLAEKSDLWNRYGAPTEKRLLFIAEDFKNPDQSDVFQELENLSPDVKQLASKLKEFCKLSIDQLEPLEAVLPKTSPAQVFYAQGITYLHSKRYNEAIVEFEKAIGPDPNYKEAHHGLGLAHLKMGNLGEAEKAAKAALRIDWSYQPARQLLDTIITIIKSSTTPPSTSTSTAPGTPGPTPSKSAFNLWQYIVPNLWQYITGTLNEALRRIEVLKRVKTESELNAMLRKRLTEQEEGTKQLRNENEVLRSQNQTLQNENVRLRVQLDEQHLSPAPLKKPELRMASPQKIYHTQKIYHNSIPRVRLAAISKNNLGYDAFNNNQYIRAIEFFDDAIKSDPQSAIAHYNLGCTYLVMKEHTKSGHYFSRAVALNPRFKEAHYNLALAFLRTDRRQLAMQVVQTALNIDKHYQPARQLLAAIKHVD